MRVHGQFGGAGGGLVYVKYVDSQEALRFLKDCQSLKSLSDLQKFHRVPKVSQSSTLQSKLGIEKVSLGSRRLEELQKTRRFPKDSQRF